MITRGVPNLNPASSKWYFLEWSSVELGDGVTISASDWGEISSGAFSATVPTGLTEDQAYQSGLTTGVRLSVDTGTVGSSYDVVNQITTSAGETIHETIRIVIGTDGH